MKGIGEHSTNTKPQVAIRESGIGMGSRIMLQVAGRERELQLLICPNVGTEVTISGVAVRE
jgi:hypothetical protein